MREAANLAECRDPFTAPRRLLGTDARLHQMRAGLSGGGTEKGRIQDVLKGYLRVKVAM